jgi:hypothetical protein
MLGGPLQERKIRWQTPLLTRSGKASPTAVNAGLPPLEYWEGGRVVPGGSGCWGAPMSNSKKLAAPLTTQKMGEASFVAVDAGAPPEKIHDGGKAPVVALLLLVKYS